MRIILIVMEDEDMELGVGEVYRDEILLVVAAGGLDNSQQMNRCLFQQLLVADSM